LTSRSKVHLTVVTIRVLFTNQWLPVHFGSFFLCSHAGQGWNLCLKPQRRPI
jgi:hypothetical protein